MDNVTLLQQLVARKIIDQGTASKLEQEASYSQEPVDQLIADRRLADGYKVAEVKAEILGVPVRKIQSSEITDEVLSIIPEETAMTYKVLPLSNDGKMLVVGMVYPDDIRAQDALRFIAKKMGVNLGIYLLALNDFELIAKRYSPYQAQVDRAVKEISQKYGNTSRGGQRVIQLDQGVAVSEEAPVIKIVASTLEEAVDRQASDIHIEPQRSRLRIRFRLDGDLKEVATFPLQLHQPIISRVKVLSELKIDENRIPQDGRFRTILAGRDIDFRVATFPTPVGEKVVLRILDPTVGLKGLKELGLSEYNYNLVTRGISRPFGMIIVSGPTGSGKTTTLYGLLQVLNNDEVNIVSLEDPVEYFIDGLNQSQVRPEIGYTFASGLRQILRQDPDVIMVGEIRDGETAELSVHAALTGHIVLSTLHTNNALAVLPRLLDLGIEKFLLPSALNLMLAQRLIGRLCQSCKEEAKISAEENKLVDEALLSMPAGVIKGIKKPYKIYTAKGCAKCNNKGIKGRVALFEVFQMTSELAEDLSNQSFSYAKVEAEAKRQGMITLRQDGIMKALAGEVLLTEVLKETE